MKLCLVGSFFDMDMIKVEKTNGIVEGSNDHQEAIYKLSCI